MRWFLAVLFLLTATSARAGQFQTLYTFTVPGQQAYSGLSLVGSTLVGMTTAAFAGDPTTAYGYTYSLNLDGSNFQLTHQFTGPDGANPWDPLTVVGSKLFGTTNGAVNYNGTVFSMNADGSNFQLLHTFSGNGAGSRAPLLATGSTLIGTEPGAANGGDVFSMDQSGSNFHDLHSFTGTGGANPVSGLLQFGAVLYGSTERGGTAGDGAVYSMNLDGSNFHVLHSFTGPENGGPGPNVDGYFPTADLAQIGSKLFGTTYEGGSQGGGTVFSMNLDGSGYQILHSFTGNAIDGEGPEGGVTAVGSTLYGTSETGGLYSINADGSDFQLLQALLSPGSAEGYYSTSKLLLVGSTLYGTTNFGGGSANAGTIFAYTIPEPSSLALAALGFIGLAAWRLRRRRIA